MNSQPPAAPAVREIQISNWRPRTKNTLRGFFSVTLPSGMILHDLMLCEKGDSRWINLPTREYKDTQGQRSFANIIEFADEELYNRFRNAVMAALDRYFAENRP